MNNSREFDECDEATNSPIDIILNTAMENSPGMNKIISTALVAFDKIIREEECVDIKTCLLIIEKIYFATDNAKNMQKFLDQIKGSIESHLDIIFLHFISEYIVEWLSYRTDDFKKQILLKFYNQIIQIAKEFKYILPSSIFSYQEMFLFKFLDLITACKNSLIQTMELQIFHQLLPDLDNQIASLFFPTQEGLQKSLIEFSKMPFSQGISEFIKSLNVYNELIFCLETLSISIGQQKFNEDRSYIEINCTQYTITLRIFANKKETIVEEIDCSNIEALNGKEFKTNNTAELSITLKEAIKINNHKSKRIRIRFLTNNLKDFHMHINDPFLSVIFRDIQAFKAEYALPNYTPSRVLQYVTKNLEILQSEYNNILGYPAHLSVHTASSPIAFSISDASQMHNLETVNYAGSIISSLISYNSFEKMNKTRASSPKVSEIDCRTCYEVGNLSILPNQRDEISKSPNIKKLTQRDILSTSRINSVSELEAFDLSLFSDYQTPIFLPPKKKQPGVKNIAFMEDKQYLLHQTKAKNQEIHKKASEQFTETQLSLQLVVNEDPSQNDKETFNESLQLLPKTNDSHLLKKNNNQINGTYQFKNSKDKREKGNSHQEPDAQRCEYLLPTNSERNIEEELQDSVLEISEDEFENEFSTNYVLNMQTNNSKLENKIISRGRGTGISSAKNSYDLMYECKNVQDNIAHIMDTSKNSTINNQYAQIDRYKPQSIGQMSSLSLESLSAEEQILNGNSNEFSFNLNLIQDNNEVENKKTSKDTGIQSTTNSNEIPTVECKNVENHDENNENHDGNNMDISSSSTIIIPSLPVPIVNNKPRNTDQLSSMSLTSDSIQNSQYYETSLKSNSTDNNKMNNKRTLQEAEMYLTSSFKKLILECPNVVEDSDDIRTESCNFNSNSQYFVSAINNDKPESIDPLSDMPIEFESPVKETTNSEILFKSNLITDDNKVEYMETSENAEIHCSTNSNENLILESQAVEVFDDHNMGSQSSTINIQCAQKKIDNDTPHSIEKLSSISLENDSIEKQNLNDTHLETSFKLNLTPEYLTNNENHETSLQSNSNNSQPMRDAEINVEEVQNNDNSKNEEIHSINLTESPKLVNSDVEKENDFGMTKITRNITIESPTDTINKSSGLEHDDLDENSSSENKEKIEISIPKKAGSQILLADSNEIDEVTSSSKALNNDPEINVNNLDNSNISDFNDSNMSLEENIASNIVINNNINLSTHDESLEENITSNIVIEEVPETSGNTKKVKEVVKVLENLVIGHNKHEVSSTINYRNENLEPSRAQNADISIDLDGSIHQENNVQKENKNHLNLEEENFVTTSQINREDDIEIQPENIPRKSTETKCSSQTKNLDKLIDVIIPPSISTENSLEIENEKQLNLEAEYIFTSPAIIKKNLPITPKIPDLKRPESKCDVISLIVDRHRKYLQAKQKKATKKYGFTYTDSDDDDLRKQAALNNMKRIQIINRRLTKRRLLSSNCKAILPLAFREGINRTAFTYHQTIETLQRAITTFKRQNNKQCNK